MYFPVKTIEPINLWGDLISMRNDADKNDWVYGLLIVEIGLCAPQSNTALERFFSQLKFIKSTIRSSLNGQSLNSLLRIKVTGPKLKEFHEEYVEDIVTIWYNIKDRRLNQKKRKSYKPRNTTTKKVKSTISVTSDPNLSSSHESSSSDDESDNE